MCCEQDEPTAWMWTMLVERQGRRSTVSWPSLCETENDAVIEATTCWGRPHLARCSASKLLRVVHA